MLVCSFVDVQASSQEVGIFNMARFSLCLMLAAGAILALLQPATAQTDAARFRYASVRHYRYVGCPCPHRTAAAIMAAVLGPSVTSAGADRSRPAAFGRACEGGANRELI